MGEYKSTRPNGVELVAWFIAYVMDASLEVFNTHLSSSNAFYMGKLLHVASSIWCLARQLFFDNTNEHKSSFWSD